MYLAMCVLFSGRQVSEVKKITEERPKLFFSEKSLGDSPGLRNLGPKTIER